MNKKLLFICVLIVLALLVFYGVTYNNNLCVYAYENTYLYTATQVEDYDITFLDSAISDIECVSINGSNYIEFTFAEPVEDFVFDIYSNTKFSYYNSPSLLSFRFNRFGSDILSSDEYIDVNFCLMGTFTGSLYTSTGDLYYCLRYTGSLTGFAISDFCLSVSEKNDPWGYAYSSFSDDNSHYYTRDVDFTNDYNSIIDLSSSSNYLFDFYDSSTILDYIYNNFSLTTYYLVVSLLCSDLGYCFDVPISSLSNSKWGFGYVSWVNGNTGESTITYDTYLEFWSSFDDTGFGSCQVFSTMDTAISNLGGIDNLDFYDFSLYGGIVVNNIEFTINTTARVLQSSLVIYNYEYYSVLDYVSSVSYSLQKDDDLYIATYSGSVSNCDYIGFTCSNLQGRLYDKYIYVSIGLSDLNLDISDNTLSLNLGFDFNFSKYYEPYVVSSTDLNNYSIPTLSKPNKLTDISGWLNYAFCWLLFYNPVMKPISSFIYSIFNVFVNSFKFILGFNLGAFVLAFIGFIVMYNMLSSISPINSVFKGLGSGANNYVKTEHRKADKKREQSIKESGDKKQEKLDRKRQSKKLNKYHKKNNEYYVSYDEDYDR